MVAQALWHLSLPPSSEIPFLVHHDIQITNASLTATLADENARSVVTMTFQPTNPRELDGEGSDDEDEDEFSGEDEEDVDEEELEAAIAAAAPTASKKSSKSKSNGTPAEVEVEDEDEDDEELDSDEEGSDISLTEEPVTSTLCALTPGKIEGITLNLVLNEDEVVIFRNEGKNEIHLLGNYVDQIPFRGGRDDYDDMENDSESEYSYDSDEEGPLDFGEDGEEDDSEMEGMDIDMEDLQRVIAGKKGGKKGDSHRFEVVDEEESKPKSKKAAVAAATEKSAPAAAAVDSKKRKADATVSTPEKAQAEVQGGKKLKNDKGEAVPAASAAGKKVDEKKEKPVEKKAEKKADKPEKQSSKKVTHPSGLVMEDVKVGDGPVAGKGKRCGMRYIGKLQNGKQFDANTAGSPFTFRLGAGEVIKGWDIGVAGMKVGGERKLTIPANLAYGNQKIPGIPPNSTLVFDIKLVNVK